MTTRDRLALLGICSLAVLAAVWMLLVSPERKEASSLAEQVSTAETALQTAESEASDARAARARYSAAYASVVNLGKAVPPSEEVPALMYQIAQASNQKHVEFNSITTTGSGAAPSTSAAATPVAVAAGFTKMPFTFVFNGSFADLYHLFNQLDEATVRTSSGGLRVSGRLLTLQGVKLEPQTSGVGKSSSTLTGTITATAYVLPSGTGLTGGATAATPAASGATTASSGTAPRATSSGSITPPAAVATAGGVR